MDLPPEVPDSSHHEEGDIPPVVVVVGDPSVHHLDDQLIFSEAQLAESLSDHHHHHHHADPLASDGTEGDGLIDGDDLAHVMEVDEAVLEEEVGPPPEDDDSMVVGEEELPINQDDEHLEQAVDSSLLDTTDEGQILETIVEEPSGAEDGEDPKQNMSTNMEAPLLPPPPPVVEEEEEEEEEEEPPCQCPSCKESSDENGVFKGWDLTKAKCLMCYVTIPAPEHLCRKKKPESPVQVVEPNLPAEGEQVDATNTIDTTTVPPTTTTTTLMEEADTQKILPDLIDQEEGGQEEMSHIAATIMTKTEATLPPIVSVGEDNNVFGIKSEARDPESELEQQLTAETGCGGGDLNLNVGEGIEKVCNLTEETAQQIKDVLTGKMRHQSNSDDESDHDNSEEDTRLNLDLLFQVLGSSFDDLDQDVDMLLNFVPLCHPCQSVVADALVIYKEIQRLENTLGNLRDTIKDQVATTFDANFCKRKKEAEEVEGLIGQIDATRRAILGEDCPAIAKLLNYRKKGRRGRKPGRKKKTVINRSALYPQVTLESGSKKRGRPKKQYVDASGVKQEYNSDPDFDDEFGDDEQEEEHEVIQTHSGRRVKKPNYKKWLMGDDDEEEERTTTVQHIKAEKVEDEGGASPKSEPDWSPGHSDDEFHEGADSETSSDDSDVNSDEENEFDDDDDEDDDDYRERAPARKRRRSSAGPRIPCPECSRTFADDEKKDKHFARYHEPGGERHGRRRRGRGGGSLKVHSCEHCDKEFKRPNLLKRHLEKDHGIMPENGESSDKKKHICEFCGQKYRNGSELRVHVRLHTGETPFKCDHCDQSFVSALKRETHIEQCHWEVPPLKCEFCDRAFFRQHRLRIHRITHTGERAYLCEICSQAFSHPTYLKYHQGQHAELNMESYKCKECGKQFANPTNLKLHVKTVHLKEFRFSCEVCGMGFTHMSHKRIHMRGHTGERPYKCEICGESFRYKDRLRIHLRGHTGERPFVCDVCKKGFASRSKLKRHEKIHEKSLGNRSSQEEEPQRPLRYSCDDCGKAFAEPQHLSAHKRYCQRKNYPEKEEKPRATKSGPGKIKPPNVATAPAVVPPPAAPVAATVQKIQIEHIPTHAIQPQQAQMLVPVTYTTYPVAYGYEVAQQYHQQQQPPSNVRDYPNYN